MKKIAAVLALILFCSSAAAFSADKASIIYIEGDVTMNGSPASVGDDVRPGATIRTAPDALCEVVFNRKNIVHLAGGTSLTFDPQNLSRGATLIAVVQAADLRNGDDLALSHDRPWIGRILR